jgi:hypothetical protein
MTCEAYNVFPKIVSSGLIQHPEKCSTLLKTLMKQTPNKESAQIVPVWIGMILNISKEMLADQSSLFYSEHLETVFNSIFHFLDSSKPSIHKATAENLKQVLSSISVETDNINALLEPLCLIAETIQEATISFKYQEVLPHILTVLDELYIVFPKLSALHSNVDIGLETGVKYLDKLVSQPTVTQEVKALLMQSIGAAANALGMREITRILPLNLIPRFVVAILMDLFLTLLVSSASGAPRGWLIPLLRDHVTQSKDLDFFWSSILPLANQLLSRAQEFAQSGKVIEVRVHETLYQQLWAMFPTFFVAIPENFEKVLFHQSKHH